MFVVFVLTAVGLAIFGIPLWLVLAIIAGLLNFIPNFGPLIAMVPAVLVALMVRPVTAAMVTVMYIVIQVIETNFITPFRAAKIGKHSSCAHYNSPAFNKPLNRWLGAGVSHPSNDDL